MTILATVGVLPEKRKAAVAFHGRERQGLSIGIRVAEMILHKAGPNGGGAMESRTRPYAGKTLCIPCSGRVEQAPV